MTDQSAELAKRLDDDQLADMVCASATGWQDHFDELYKRHYGRMVRYFVGRGFSIADAEDLAETAFVKLLEKRSFDSSKGQFRAWIYTIARREAINYFRWFIRYVTLSGDEEDPGLEAEFVSLEPLPDIEAEHAQLVTIVHACIERLSSIDREIIDMRTFREFAYREIAAQLIIQENAAMQRHFHALQRLRECVVTQALGRQTRV